MAFNPKKQFERTGMALAGKTDYPSEFARISSNLGRSSAFSTARSARMTHSIGTDTRFTGMLTICEPAITRLFQHIETNDLISRATSLAPAHASLSRYPLGAEEYRRIAPGRLTTLYTPYFSPYKVRSLNCCARSMISAGVGREVGSSVYSRCRLSRIVAGVRHSAKKSIGGT